MCDGFARHILPGVACVAIMGYQKTVCTTSGTCTDVPGPRSLLALRGFPPPLSGHFCKRGYGGILDVPAAAHPVQLHKFLCLA